MHYYIGDIPGSVPVTPASVQDLSGLNAASVTLTYPDGTEEALSASFNGSTVTLSLPEWTTEGVHTLNVVLSGSERKVALESARIIVESTDGGGWHTLDAARRAWNGAPEDDTRLYDLLQTSRIQVLEFAPALALGAPVPVNYKAAELAQARNIWNASITDPNSGQMNGDGYQVPVYPLDWNVKQMIRPRRAVPVVA